ncbi:hypothetical protein V5799_003877 [Amblyomma americanum]|uniref:Uncharacterized protein n=1 Tax=Amblyomma americanum TaxID=6943 RepID=A0AAQ4D7Q2_AMBAM
MEEEPTSGRSSRTDVIYVDLELLLEVERRHIELLLKEEELKERYVQFHRVIKASEQTYLAARDEITRKKALLLRVIQALEAEVDLVSGCPRLMQLLCSLRGGGGGGGLEATSVGDTPSSP